jgi:hypothetical protein
MRIGMAVAAVAGEVRVEQLLAWSVGLLLVEPHIGSFGGRMARKGKDRKMGIMVMM